MTPGARGRPGGVEARILYWGIAGAGKTANLRTIYDRLQPGNRGEMREIPTPIDPTVRYEVLPIELGEVRGVQTRIQIIAAPGAPEQAPTRKQLLDGVDGLVFVADAQRERVDENLASFNELRLALLAYGRSLESLPVVVQYNKHDLADPIGLEELYRKLEVKGAAVFETVATEGNGALRTLTTISKRVLRMLREQAADAQPPPPREPAATDYLNEISSDVLERAILAEATGLDDSGPSSTSPFAANDLLGHDWQLPDEDESSDSGARPPGDLRIVSLGRVTRIDAHAVRVPLVLEDGEGQERALALTVRLDPLIDGEEEDF